jgi:hypothetical protein
VALPLTNAAKETYQLAARQGHAQEDFSAIYAFLIVRDGSLRACTRRATAPRSGGPS